jgi:hypothetical protein
MEKMHFSPSVKSLVLAAVSAPEINRISKLAHYRNACYHITRKLARPADINSVEKFPFPVKIMFK